MLSFGIIAEGPTDQTVIRNILLGYFADQEEEPAINYVQPPRPLTEQPGGWGNVFHCLKQREYEGARQFNDYLVIHIDADKQDEPGFDVSRRERGKELSVSERVDRVIARLRQDIDTSFYESNADRILFAIAVDTIECWLLPTILSDKKRAAKTTGCIESADRALRRKNLKPLTAGENKIPVYDAVSSAYRNHKTLMKLRDKNPSLELFVKQLDQVGIAADKSNEH